MSNNKAAGEDLAVTDDGNYIVDLHLESLVEDPIAFAPQIAGIFGVVEHGVFPYQADVILYPEREEVLSIVRPAGEKRAKM